MTVPVLCVAAVKAFWAEHIMARSHIKLWWGDLVISNRPSRHRAGWSNGRLRQLAERRQQEREAQDAEWSRMKGGAANNNA